MVFPARGVNALAGLQSGYSIVLVARLSAAQAGKMLQLTRQIVVAAPAVVKHR